VSGDLETVNKTEIENSGGDLKKDESKRNKPKNKIKKKDALVFQKIKRNLIIKTEMQRVEREVV
jgi:hypothetical protein